jgi:6-pyruvoyltetrahydropterin/6-carboxytetrahydropterin synthase
MWKLEKDFRFEAAHVLPHHDGKCKRLHGHSFKGKVICESDKIDSAGPKAGMVIDYGDIDAALSPLIEGKLDHFHLNETTGLESPTTEELSRYIYNYLKPKLPLLAAIELEETCTARCEYRPQVEQRSARP